MAKVTMVASARVDQGKCGKCGEPITRGQQYLWWKFRTGSKHVRCMLAGCSPRPQELTQSEWTRQVLDFDDALAEIISKHRLRGDGEHDNEELATELEQLESEVRAFGEDQQSKLDNMPEQLQDGDTGNLLRDRADAMEAAADELQSAMDAARDIELVDATNTSELIKFSESDDCLLDAEDFEPGEYMEAVREAAEQYNATEIDDVLNDLEGITFDC